MVRKFELMPIDGRKSFYGKATVMQYSDNLAILKSYGTEVAAIKNGKFIRMWSGYSTTTMRHVNAFLYAYSIPGGGKAFWDAQPVSNYNPLTDIITAAAFSGLY